LLAPLSTGNRPGLPSGHDAGEHTGTALWTAMCANPENLWTTSAHPAPPLWIRRTFCLFRRHVLRSRPIEAVEKKPVKNPCRLKASGPNYVRLKSVDPLAGDPRGNGSDTERLIPYLLSARRPRRRGQGIGARTRRENLAVASVPPWHPVTRAVTARIGAASDG
jgi:hypothetical protein